MRRLLAVLAALLAACTEHPPGQCTSASDCLAGQACRDGLCRTPEVEPDRVPPSVVGRTPPVGATDVLRSTSVQAVFDEAIDPATVTASSFRLEAGGGPVAAVVSVAGAIVTLEPAAPLAHDTTYTVRIGTAVTDLAGNPLAAQVTWSFSTEPPPPDTTAPAIASRSPAADATGVAASAPVRVVFSEPVSPGTVDASSFRLTDPVGTAVAGTRAVSGATVTLTPAAALAPGTTYTASVSTGIADLAGNPLAAASTWSFTTEVAPDRAPPSVVGRTPPVDATDVPRSTLVQAVFDEAIDPVTVTASSFRLEAGGAPVAAVVSAAGALATLEPAAPLAYATTYTVRLTPAVTDVAGNPLAAQVTWTFRTEPPPDAVAPRVVSRTPAIGALDVPVSTSVQATFDEPIAAATVTAASFSLVDGVGIPVIATVSASGAIVTLEPAATLTHDTTYTVRIGTAVTDLAGNPLAAQVTWSFSTEPPPDTTAPAIASRSPAADATGVATSAPVRVVFSEPVSPGTVDASSFRLTDPVGTAVAGTRAVSGATVTLTPAAALAPGTTYTVSVSTGIVDLAGNPLAAASTWSFTTACGASLVACGGTCVDTSSDAANCGGCGVICGAGRLCQAGGCVVPACGGRISLAGRPPIPLTGDGPETIASGDLDADGNVDLVVAEAQGSSVGVFLGHGDRSFGQRVEYGVGSTSGALAVADLDADGDLDVAVGGSASVGVLVGNGDGTFATVTGYGTGSTPRGVVAADLDADGKLDLAVAAKAGNVVSVLLGNGDATFRARTDFAAGARPWGIAAGDLNADGKLDLAVSNEGGASVSVLLGNGDGTFAPKVDLPGPLEPHAIVLADLDLDGKADLAVASARDGQVVLFRGNGDGTFRAAAALSSSCHPDALRAADVNGDGVPDLVTGGDGRGYQLGGACVLKGNGTGGFSSAPEATTGGIVSDLAVADLDGDGALDVATANRSSDTVSVLPGLGDGTFAPWVPVLAGSSPDQIATADVDGDGLLDLVASDTVGGASAGAIAIYRGTGPGTFAARYDVEAGKTPTRVAVGDLNRDGHPDLVYVDYFVSAVPPAGALVALLGDGAGGFGSRVEYATPPNPIDVALGDLDGDGDLDVVAATFSGGHTVFLGNGDGTFAPRVDYAGSGRGVAVADLDGDGALDVATTSYRGGVVRVELGNGDGTLRAAVTYPAGANSNRILAADLDGDGDVDLAETEGDAGTVGVLLNRGDGTFAARTEYPTGWPPDTIAAADLDGDGVVDLAVAATSQSAIAFLRGRGDGTFHPTEWFEAGGSSPHALAVADLDADGRPDLLAGTSQGVALLRNACWP